MKTLLFVSMLICGLSKVSFAQQRAVTSEGREVILNEDGTWKYASDVDTPLDSIPLNTTLFTKSATSTFLVKSTMADFGVYIDPKKWTFKKSSDGDAKEYSFDRRGKDAYVIMLSEKIEIPLESFPEVALHNAMSAAPDARIVNKEYRTVNGNKVLCMEMTGSSSGIRFTYYGYYISNESGTVQLVGFTSQKLFKEHKAEIEELLNGITAIKR